MPHINIIESIANFFINALLSTRIIPKAIYIENDLCYSISEFVKTYNLKGDTNVLNRSAFYSWRHSI